MIFEEKEQEEFENKFGINVYSMGELSDCYDDYCNPDEVKNVIETSYLNKQKVKDVICLSMNQGNAEQKIKFMLKELGLKE